MPTYRIKTTETVTDHLTHWYDVEAESLQEVLDMFDDLGFATRLFYNKYLCPIDTKADCGESAGDECLCEVRQESYDPDSTHLTSTLVYPSKN